MHKMFRCTEVEIFSVVRDSEQLFRQLGNEGHKASQKVNESSIIVCNYT